MSGQKRRKVSEVLDRCFGTTGLTFEEVEASALDNLGIGASTDRTDDELLEVLLHLVADEVRCKTSLQDYAPAFERSSGCYLTQDELQEMVRVAVHRFRYVNEVLDDSPVTGYRNDRRRNLETGLVGLHVLGQLLVSLI